ncbi:hypothetical protein GIB67_006562 [Kingdonia uniflora]|uniref:Uncharacterized protein n=1 Tax=Kingdonia uniflora TaxID=39325 RepID=A0A7J7LER2_9MAGN|nr:hypothetical protein GIB67_006562 [Kingdonia uniflora]
MIFGRALPAARASYNKKCQACKILLIQLKGEWNIYMEKTETHYSEDTASVEREPWKKRFNTVPSPSRKAQCCISGFYSQGNGMEANQVVCAQLSSAAKSFLEDLDVANRNLLCSIEDSLALDNEVH